jgi:predicted nucleotidyltransferase
MVAVISDKLDELKVLCERFGVTKLELFGSAATGEFDQSRSDLDFLVEFERLQTMNAFHQYFGFRQSLEDLFGRKIDLVDPKAMRNPYFIRSVNQSRTTVHVA